jgi:hypothetical protein
MTTRAQRSLTTTNFIYEIRSARSNPTATATCNDMPSLTHQMSSSSCTPSSVNSKEGIVNLPEHIPMLEPTRDDDDPPKLTYNPPTRSFHDRSLNDRSLNYLTEQEPNEHLFWWLDTHLDTANAILDSRFEIPSLHYVEYMRPSRQSNLIRRRDLESANRSDNSRRGPHRLHGSSISPISTSESGPKSASSSRPQTPIDKGYGEGRSTACANRFTQTTPSSTLASWLTSGPLSRERLGQTQDGREADMAAHEAIRTTQETNEGSCDSEAWTDDEVLSEWDLRGTPHSLLKSQVVDRLMARFLRLGEQSLRSRGNGGIGGSSTSQNYAQQSFSSSSGSKSAGKRKQEDDPAKDRNDDRQRRRRRLGSPTSNGRPFLLACPFYKHDRSLFKTCGAKVLRGISRVKYHLLRNHQELIHCDRCFKPFKNDSSRKDHLRKPVPCEVTTPIHWSAITIDQKQQLAQRIPKQKTTRENWYEIYKLLFGDKNLPDSPYLDDIESKELRHILAFAQQEGPSIVEELMTHLPERSRVLRLQEHEISSFLQSATQDFVTTIFERWEAEQRVTAAASQSAQGPAHQPDESPESSSAGVVDPRAGSQSLRTEPNLRGLVPSTLASSSGGTNYIRPYQATRPTLSETSLATQPQFSSHPNLGLGSSNFWDDGFSADPQIFSAEQTWSLTPSSMNPFDTRFPDPADFCPSCSIKYFKGLDGMLYCLTCGFKPGAV